MVYMLFPLVFYQKIALQLNLREEKLEKERGR